MPAISSSLFWKFLERFGTQSIQFVLSILIARILSPKEYGIISVLMIFISIATIFVQSGLSSALIQKKKISSIDYSSVLYYSLGISSLLYLLLFFLSDAISQFFLIPELSIVIKFSSVTLFFGAYNSIQIAYASRKMEFKKLFICSFLSGTFSGLVGVILAYTGYGVWALVAQQLLNQILNCLFLSLVVAWRPTWEFSLKGTRSLLNFGLGILGANLVDRLYHNLVSVIIGKKYSSETLALFEKGKQFPLILMDNIDGSIQSVMFPVYSLNQDNLDGLKKVLSKAISMSTFLAFVAMGMMFAMSESFVLFILGKQWLECVPFLQFYCVISSLFPLQTAVLQAVNAIGYSRMYFRIITIKRIVGVMLLVLFSIFFKNILFILIACLLIEIVSIIIIKILAFPKLNYSIKQFFIDVFPNVVLGILILFSTFSVKFLNLGIFHTLIIQTIVGLVSLIGFSYVFKNPSFYYFFNKYLRRSKND